MTNMTLGIAKTLQIAVLMFALIAMSTGTALAYIAPAVKVGVKYLDDVLDIAAKISGKTLTPAARKAALSQLRNAAAKHGDNAILAARKGGLELMKVAGKYGDDVWNFASKVPAGARALAMRSKELLPLARRIGSDVLRLEARSPGIAKHVVKSFGDDGVRYFAKHVPAVDASRLIGYAGRANTPATRQMLMDYYKKGGTNFLDKLNWKHIVASGLSASMIISAYKVSDGIQEGLKKVAENSPDTFKETFTHGIDRVTMPIVTPATLLGIGLTVIWLFRYCHRTRRKPITGKQRV